MTAVEASTLQARQGWRVFHVSSDNVDEAIEAVQSGAADGFFLASGRGFRPKDFPKLCATPNLKGIAAVTPGDIDWHLLNQRRDLSFLDLAYAHHDIDLSLQERLESLSIIYNPKSHLPPPTAPLRRLIIRGYSPKAGDLSELTAYPSLEYLSCTQGKLRSLNGASSIAKLKTACFHYQKCLASVADLSHSPVETLVLDRCPKVTDVETLTMCSALKEFFYIKCRPLQSLRFLNHMKAIEVFTFVETNVLDGDMSPLLRLLYSGFDDKRHFSHSYKQVQEHIAAQQRSTSPQV